VQQTVGVGKGSQTITITSTASTNPIGNTYTPSATASSGLTVAITIDSTTSANCSISGGVVTFDAVDNCVIDFNQAGDANYNAAPQVQQTVGVVLDAQTITITSTAPTNPAIGGTYTPTATASSGLAVAITIDSSSSSVCSISAGLVTFNAQGSCLIDFDQAGNANYAAATQVQQTVGVGLVSQTITITSTAPTSPAVGDTYTPTATASSGLTVAITIDSSSSSICSISGGVVTFDAVGDCVIDFDQAGDSTYDAAPEVQQSLTVGQGSQTITFTSTAPTDAVVGTDYTPTATASSGLTVTFTIDSTTSANCSILAGIVLFTAVGDCTVDANQAGDSDYAAATQVQQTFTVGQGSQTITITSTAPTDAVVGGPTYTPTATASSELTVAITIDSSSSSVCSISSGAVTFKAAGSCVIDFNQAGNADYAAAPQVQQTVTVTSLAVTTSSLAQGTVGTAYSETLAASGGTSPYTWSLSSGSLPAGLTLDASTGVISGTPTTAGTSDFTVEVTDSTTPTALTATKDLSIVIVSSGSLSVTTTSLAQGTVGTAYSATLAASGGTSPYTWSLPTGTLPAGLTLAAATGAISGTPTTAGIFDFTVEVTDSSTPTAQTATADLSIVVVSSSGVIALSGGVVGVPYSETATVTGGTPPYTWSITAGALPPGLTIDASSGGISGTPTTAGTFTFTVMVTDSTVPTPETASGQFSITITAAGSATTTGNTTGGGSSSGGSLPYTGENIERLLEMSLGAILLGGLLLLAVGRRRRFGSTRTPFVPGFAIAETPVWTQWRRPGPLHGRR
jgi:hypothetical protein